MKKFQIIILAGGSGSRMQSGELPKVLVELDGRPMIAHLLDSVRDSGVDDDPAIVVGHKAREVMAALGPEYTYINQAERLGTGHAVLAGRSVLENRAENVMVLLGDHPLVSAQTIAKLAGAHLAEKTVLTLATTEIPDFEDWRGAFYDAGRIVRNGAGEIVKIVEKKEASPEELAIRELNSSYLCFKASWLWPSLSRLPFHVSQNEYYLTDLIKTAVAEGRYIHSVSVDPREALGVNTQEQLSRLASVR